MDRVGTLYGPAPLASPCAVARGVTMYEKASRNTLRVVCSKKPFLPARVDAIRRPIPIAVVCFATCVATQITTLAATCTSLSRGLRRVELAGRQKGSGSTKAARSSLSLIRRPKPLEPRESHRRRILLVRRAAVAYERVQYCLAK